MPVLDLRRYLELTPRALRPTDYLIIFHVNQRLLAIRVDRALDVSIVDPATNDEISASHSGVVHIQDGTVIILNMAPLLAKLETVI